MPDRSLEDIGFYSLDRRDKKDIISNRIVFDLIMNIYMQDAASLEKRLNNGEQYISESTLRVTHLSCIAREWYEGAIICIKELDRRGFSKNNITERFGL